MNYNKEVRKSVNRLNENFKNTFGPNLYMDGSFDIKFDGSLDTDEDKIAKVFDTMLKMTAYNDLYSKYALMQKCNTLSEFDSEVFEMLKNISSFDEFNDKISSSTELFSLAMKEMIEFYNSSVFHKILRRKSLNENDIDNIKRINTLFDYDLESYNKDVDAEYIGKKVSSCMNSKYFVEDLLDESAIFLHTFLLIDKKSAEKILLEMIKNNVLIINYMEKMNELYNDKLLTVEVESDNYNLKYVKKYLENHDIDKLPYDLIYQINANNVIFYKLNSEIYNISVSDDKEKILDSVKKYELKDK